MHNRVAIVGSGFAGIGAAVRLKQRGVDDLVLLERAGDVGGTWRDNTYPGCQCDVSSHLYSFSFALNPAWTRTYPLQPELGRYLRDVSDRYDVTPHVQFHTPMLDARWDDDAQRWVITTTAGERTSDVLVLANGPLSEPKLPDVPGLDRFEGATFHSAAWDHRHEFAGERVAVVGTGASAIQFLPHIQQAASEVVLFQRTPPWVLPHPDRPIPRWRRAAYRRVPALQRAVRLAGYWMRETWLPAFAKRPKQMAVTKAIALRHLAKQVPDPELREKLTPAYTPGCKRLLLSNDWFPALSAPNVSVVASGVVEVRERSVVAADGTEHEVDTIVFGTGFHVTDNPIMAKVHGRDGRSLAQVWAGTGMRAYKGTAVDGFPNLFLLGGPNTGIAHTSLVVMLEAQVRYLTGALDFLERSRAAAVEVRPEQAARWNDDLQAKMAGTVWSAGGCASWYQDGHGRNPTLWPDYTWRFVLATRRFDADAFHVLPRVPARELTAVPA